MIWSDGFERGGLGLLKVKDKYQVVLGQSK
jgi:hypothetical protein